MEERTAKHLEPEQAAKAVVQDEQAPNAMDDENASSREHSPARRPLGIPRIQVKSQNPMSKPSRRSSRPPSPSPKGQSHADPRSPSLAAAPKQHAPDRLRGGAAGAEGKPAKSTPRSPRKSPARSPKTPAFVPADVITPVFPASPEDMVGAQTSMATGLTYPYNLWGPITKYGYRDDVAPAWAQKHHFQGKHDKLAKKRLHSRRFSHSRWPAYKELIEPEEKVCSSYLDPKRKEFWRTDVLNVLQREMKVKKDRYKRLLEFLGNKEEFWKSELQRNREDKWKAFLDYDKNVKWYPGFRNNESSVKYNIITKVPMDEYEKKRVEAETMKKRYKLAQRGLYIQERMSGARPFDIISWRKIPNCRKLPPWPDDIGPPPGPRHDESMIPLNSSKGALSFAYPFGPFGTIGNGR